MLAARKVPAAVKWIEDRRENLMSAGQARHEHGAARMAFDDDGTILAAADRPRAGRRRLPDAVAGRHRGRGRACSSRARTGPGDELDDDVGVLQHAPAAPRTAGRGSSSRSPARCCSTSPPAASASTPSSCAAATCSAPTSCRTRTPTACRTTTCRRAETFEQALEMLDYDAFRREQAEARAPGRYLGVGTRSYVEPTTTGDGLLRDRGRDDPHRAVGQGQRVRRRRLDRQQPRDHRRAAHRRRARRRHRRRQHDPGRHRAHAVRRWAPAAAAAAR